MGGVLQAEGTRQHLGTARPEDRALEKSHRVWCGQKARARREGAESRRSSPVGPAGSREAAPLALSRVTCATARPGRTRRQPAGLQVGCVGLWGRSEGSAAALPDSLQEGVQCFAVGWSGGCGRSCLSLVDLRCGSQVRSRRQSAVLTWAQRGGQGWRLTRGGHQLVAEATEQIRGK